MQPKADNGRVCAVSIAYNAFSNGIIVYYKVINYRALNNILHNLRT